MVYKFVYKLCPVVAHVKGRRAGDLQLHAWLFKLSCAPLSSAHRLHDTPLAKNHHGFEGVWTKERVGYQSALSMS